MGFGSEGVRRKNRLSDMADFPTRSPVGAKAKNSPDVPEGAALLEDSFCQRGGCPRFCVVGLSFNTAAFTLPAK